MDNSDIKFERRKRRTRYALKKNASDKLRLSVYRSEKNIYVQIIDDKAGKTLVNVPANKKMESFEIPAGVEVIGELSVRCLEIKELIIPDTVTKIERYAIYSNGLTELTIPGSVETLEDESIYYCSDLESIKFEEGSLKEISTMAINTCYKLEKTVCK